MHAEKIEERDGDSAANDAHLRLDKTEDRVLEEKGDGRIKWSVETITPERAQGLLAHARHANSPYKPAIEAYAASMRDDLWIVNGMPIIIDTEGRLADGVQRLNACIVADKPFRTLIARNVPADTLHTVDQHRRRQYQNVLEARGIENAGAVARLMSKLIRLEDGTYFDKRQRSAPWSRLERVLKANPELHDAVRITKGGHSALQGYARPVFAFEALAAGHRKELEDFLDVLAKPLDFPKSHPGHVVGHQLEAADAINARPDENTSLALVTLAFNDLLEGRTQGIYKWKPDTGTKKRAAPKNNGLPLVDGYPGLRDALPEEHDGGTTPAGDMEQDVRAGIMSGENSIEVETVLIDPDTARKWLELHNTKNRKIQRNHIAAIARDIQNDFWMVNAQPICFAGNPFTAEGKDDATLLNGQHRLYACIRADMPIEVPVAVNVSEKAWPTYDNQRKRTTIRTGAKGDDRAFAAAYKLRWRLDEGYSLESTKMPSATELKLVAEKYPDMPDYFSEARKFSQFAPAGAMMFFIHMVREEDPILADQFLQQLQDGLNVTRGNPVGKLRERLLSTKGEATRKQKLMTLIAGWQQYKDWDLAERKKAEEAERQHNLL